MKDNRLDVEKITRDFEEHERSGKKGKLRIDSKFDRAMKSILQAKPEPKLSKTKKKQNH